MISARLQLNRWGSRRFVAIAALQALRDRAQGDGNLVEGIMGAVVALATVGEISDVMRDTFGAHHKQL